MSNSVVVDYQAKTAQFITDTQRAAKAHSAAMTGMKEQALSAAKALGLLYAAHLVGSGLREFITSTVDATEQLAHLKEKLGISAEALGGLRLAAVQSNVPMDQLGRMVTKVAGIQFAAASGTKAAAAEMKFFGITAKDTADTAVDKLLKAFAAMPPSFDRAGLAVKIFGQRLGTNFLLVADKAREGLQGLEADAKRLGVGLSDNTLKAAEDFEKTMGLLKLQFQAVGESIITEALPALESFAKDLSDPAIRDGLKSIAEGAISALSSIMSMAAGFANAVRNMKEDVAAARYGAAQGDIQREKDELDRLQARMQWLHHNAGSGFGNIKAIFTPDPQAVEALRDNAMGAILHPILPAEEYGYLSKQYQQVHVQLGHDLDEIAAQSAKTGDAAAAGAKAGKDATDAAGASVAAYRKQYEQLLKDLNTTTGAHHGAHGAAKPKNDPSAGFASYVDNLSPKGFDTGDKELNAYAQGIAALNTQMQKAIDKGASFKDASLIFDQGHIVLLGQYQQKEADLAAQMQAEVAAYSSALKDQLDDRRNSLALQAQAIGMGRQEAQQAQEIASVRISSQRQIDQYQKSEAAATTSIEKSKFKELIEAERAYEQQSLDVIKQGDKDKLAQMADWHNGVKSALQDYADQANDVAGQVNNAMTHAFTGMEDALVNFVTTGKLNFKQLATSILADLARIEIKILLSKALESIFGNFGDSGGFGLGGYTGSTHAQGDAFSGGNVIPFARGGIVGAPTIFPMASGRTGLMGEAGPEAIMPLSRGSDGKLGVMSHGGGGNEININIITNVSESGASTQTSAADRSAGAAALAEQIRAGASQVVLRALQPGGVLWRSGVGMAA